MHGLFAFALAILATQHVPDGHAIETHSEIDFSAQCIPQSDVVNPSSIVVRMTFSSTHNGPIATATMSTSGSMQFGATSTTPHWQTPERGWVSFVFEGPPLSTRYYCQDHWGEKSLHLSYEKTSDIKLLLGNNGGPSTTELDNQPTERRTRINLQPSSSDPTVYAAGHGSQNPFWLQIAVPVYLPGEARTILHNDFL